MDVSEDDCKNGNGAELTKAEAALYDRQIRLWGLESQKRLRTAKVLVAGLCGLGAEVTKNIILAGVHSLTLLDDQLVTETDFCSQFLVQRSSLGKNRAEASISRARALNPLVSIMADKEALTQKNAEFFAQFDVVVVIGATNSELLRIDTICREQSVKFFASDVWGMFGYCFADLQNHTFVEDVVKHKVISKPNEKIKTEMVTSTAQRELKFAPYAALINYDINSSDYRRKLKRTGPSLIWLRILQEFREAFGRDPSCKTREKDIDQLVRIRNEITSERVISIDYSCNVFGQISPVAAIVGGMLSQEIIKVVTRREAPNCNVFLFDSESCCGFIETIGIN